MNPIISICFEDIKSTFEGICPKKFTISTYMSFRTISIKIHISYCQEQPPSQVVKSRQTINLMMFIRHPQILTKKIIKHLSFWFFLEDKNSIKLVSCFIEYCRSQAWYIILKQFHRLFSKDNNSKPYDAIIWWYCFVKLAIMNAHKINPNKKTIFVIQMYIGEYWQIKNSYTRHFHFQYQKTILSRLILMSQQFVEF